MKLDVRVIIVDYLNLIKGNKWDFYSIMDVSAVFGVPAIAAVTCYWFQSAIGTPFFLSMFTLLGVFIAVFVAMQGVLVPLFHKERDRSKDAIVDRRLFNDFKMRRRLVRETSQALSYLTLFSACAMVGLMLPIATNSPIFLFKWSSVYIIFHIFINMVIVFKRLHALFSHEFSDA